MMRKLIAQSVNYAQITSIRESRWVVDTSKDSHHSQRKISMIPPTGTEETKIVQNKILRSNPNPKNYRHFFDSILPGVRKDPSQHLEYPYQEMIRIDFQ